MGEREKERRLRGERERMSEREKEYMRGREGEKEHALAPPFICFFPPPWACPMQIELS